jgi:hypothetical protein
MGEKRNAGLQDFLHPLSEEVTLPSGLKVYGNWIE